MPKKLVRKDYNEEQRLYEEREKLEAEYMNQEGAFFRFIKNRNVILGFLAVVIVVSVFGVSFEYLRITKEQDEQTKQVQAPLNPLSPTPEEAAEKLRREEERERKEEEEEMKKLQEGFKPFENDGVPVHDEPGLHGHAPADVGGIPHDTSMPDVHPLEQPPVVSPESIREPEQTTPPDVPKFELKGISQKNGTTFCYVFDGEQTVRLEEGDTIRGRVLERIGTNYVVLLNEANGEREMVNN